MTMDKIIERTRFEYPDGSSVNSNAVDVVWYKLKKLLAPKLQWKSEENTYYGGTVLLSRIHSVVNCDIDIQIYDPGDISPYVTWNGKHVFEGTLEECKQFCSDKILNDFLKLCE